MDKTVDAIVQHRPRHEETGSHFGVSEDTDPRVTLPDGFALLREPHKPSASETWTARCSALVVLAAVLAVNVLAPPMSMVDRILLSSFVVFAVGFAVLMMLFVVMTILGHINLPGALQDKPASGCAEGTSGISLSRFQVFLWTLVILTTYFHEAVTDGVPGLPTIPPELLMVMGISSAAYLTSKSIAARSGKRSAGGGVQ